MIVDSKALFTLIGSTMDWREDELSNGFTFESKWVGGVGWASEDGQLGLINTLSLHFVIDPNVKEMCGCGQSFMT